MWSWQSTVELTDSQVASGLLLAGVNDNARRLLTDTAVELALIPRLTGAAERAVQVTTARVVATVMRRFQTLIDVLTAVCTGPARIIARPAADSFVTPAVLTATLVGTVCTPVTVVAFCNIVHIITCLHRMYRLRQTTSILNSDNISLTSDSNTDSDESHELKVS